MRTTVILILLATYCVDAAKHTTTAGIGERIRMLKDTIRQSLRNPSDPDPEPAPQYYESDENSPIKPISENDELKKDDKFMLKQLKKDKLKLQKLTADSTTRVILRTENYTDVKRLDERITAISKSLTTQLLPTSSKQALDIFYRKSYNGPLLNTPLEWVHCSEHITPYLKGVVAQLTKPRKTQAGDHIVHRLAIGFDSSTSLRNAYTSGFVHGFVASANPVILYKGTAKCHLAGIWRSPTGGVPPPCRRIAIHYYYTYSLVNILKSNITRMSRTEKKSVMFQMSKLKIRLYAWDYTVLNHLFSTIAKYYARSSKLDFKTLKRGMVNLLGILNADLSNTTRLLVQAKIFRPPCIYTDKQGPTKFVPGSTLSVPLLKMADSPECVRRDQNNNCID